MIGVLVSLAYVLLAVLLMLVLRVGIPDFVGPIRLLPAVTLVLASVLAGFLTDYFRPARNYRRAR